MTMNLNDLATQLAEKGPDGFQRHMQFRKAIEEAYGIDHVAEGRRLEELSKRAQHGAAGETA